MVKLLRGGAQLGAATLTRFFSLHVLLLPLLLIAFALLHISLVIRQGIAPRPMALEEGAPARTSDPEYEAYYHDRYAKSKLKDARFWPDIIAKDVVVATVIILVLFLLAHFVGAGLEPPADPSDTSYVPLPEWYFLPFYQLLKLVPGRFESVITVGVPAGIVLILVLLPFFDRRSKRSLFHRPVAAVILVGTVVGSGLLMAGALRADRENVRLASSGVPLTSLERAGRALVKNQNCSACHVIGDEKPDASGDVNNAPDLNDVGFHHSSGWLHSFIENPARFHPDTKMPSYGLPKLSHMEMEEIARYLSTLRGSHSMSETPQIVDTFPEFVQPMEH